MKPNENELNLEYSRQIIDWMNVWVVVQNKWIFLLLNSNYE